MDPMRMKRTFLTVLAISSLSLLSACFPSLGDIIGGGGGGSPATVSGKWSTAITSSHGSSNNQDLEFNLSQSTGTISAAQSVIVSSFPCEFGTDFIQGTVKSNTITFTLAFGTGHPTATFTGTVSSDGLTMSGSYKVPSGDCTASDSGSWAATKFGDSSGSYSGELTSSVTSRTIEALAVVQEDASNNLLVTVSLTNGGCSSLNLTGKAIGSFLDLQNSNGTIDVIGQGSNPTFAILSVVGYTIGGTTCGTADEGTGTLTKTAANVVIRSNAKAPINPATQSLVEKIRENLNATRK
ncbi:MAG TPA: hypothetical protein VNV84_03295 [Candidatus Acidoferrales bacterium]|nr:hypothetical protein [Candidatus Acidoferrales bacterium]